MIEQLNNCKTREEANELIKNMSKTELKGLAYRSNIFVKSNLDRDLIIDRIIASTVGMNKMFASFMGEDFSNNKWN